MANHKSAFDARPASGYGPRDNRERGQMAAPNVTLPEELLTAVTEIARAEGKTPDELITETTQKMLQLRGLRSFVAENRRLAEQQGLSEGDVPRLVKEYRREQRGR
jgi:hypothetical protein